MYSVSPLLSVSIRPNVALVVTSTVAVTIGAAMAATVVVCMAVAVIMAVADTAAALAPDGITGLPAGLTAYYTPATPSPLASPAAVSLPKR